MSFYQELKRRNVFKVAIAYIIVGWLLLQVSDTLVPALLLPAWFHSGVAFILILGFPVAMIFAWAFEMTPDGLKKERDIEQKQTSTKGVGRKWDFVIIGLLVTALGYFGWDKFIESSDLEAEQAETVAQITQGESSGGRGSVPTDKSIAVLPFINMSSDPEQEYFSDGLSEELLNLLAKIPELRVISRSSAFAFKGEKIDIPSVAKKLNVAHILEGSVRKSGNRIRITAQLIEAATDTHMWSETYDRELNDIFAIQDEIAAAVVEQMKISLLGALPTSKPINPEAYALVLKARYITSLGGGEDIWSSAEVMLRKALELEPGYARAMVELANLYWYREENGFLTAAEADKITEALLTKAFAIAPDDPNVLTWLAWGAYEENDLAAMAELLQRAVELDTSLNQVQTSYVLSMMHKLGRFAEAIAYGQFRLARDPLCAECSYALARTYRYAGQFDQAEKLIRDYQIFSPQSGIYSLAVTLLAKGEPRAAYDALENWQNSSERLQGMALALYDMGKMEESAELLRQLQDGWPEDHKIMAQAYAWMGDAEAAVEKLELHVNDTPHMFWTEYQRILYRRIHSDPRWQAMLEKYGTTPEQLAKIPFTIKIP